MGRKKYNSIEECVQTYSLSIQKLLFNIMNAIRNIVPEAVEDIVWDLPTFYYNKNILIQFGVFKDHISLFPGSDMVKKYENKIKDNFTYKVSVIHIPLDKPFPYDLLEELINSKIIRLDKLKK